MSYEYLATLAVTDVEREKLRQLGAPSALALRCMIDASPQAFASFVGGPRLEEIKSQLDAQISEVDRKTLESLSKEEFGLGAELGDPPHELKKRV